MAAITQTTNQKTLIIALLIFATFASYSATLHFGLVDFDDPAYVGHNRFVLSGLSLEDIRWAFTTFNASNWHPLTWLSLQMDASLYGDRFGGFHLTNLCLHAAAGILLFLVLQALTARVAAGALVALLFIVHPTHVESVAWISERKDVLSAALGMLGILIYIGYVRQPTPRRYLLLIAVFAFGLMAKSMLVTLPFILCLLDFWPLNRLSEEGGIRKILVEKLPLFAMVPIVSAATFLAQNSTGTVMNLSVIPFTLRLKIAILAYVKYLGMTFYPVHLGVYYPVEEIPWMHAAAAGALLLGISILAWVTRRSRPYLIVGWLWFLGTLVPVIGLVQVGEQSMADRYTYLPSIGIFLALVWGLIDLVKGVPFGRKILAIGAVAALLLFCVGTRRQVEYWRSSISLWEHAIEVTSPANTYAAYNLATNYIAAGQIGAAESLVAEALADNQSCRVGRCRFGKGMLLQASGEIHLLQKQPREALALLTEALDYLADQTSARLILIDCFLDLGDVRGMAPHAVYLVDKGYAPSEPAPWLELARKLADSGLENEGVQILEAMAANYARQGRFEEAVSSANGSLQLAASRLPAHVPQSEELLRKYRELQ